MNILPQIEVLPETQKEFWYKDAIIYQLHVKAFADSNNDGIGDFAGLTQQLDYLQDLGVNALWLLPFYPSPGKDDGYDIADYRRINPDFGTLRDFKRFITRQEGADTWITAEPRSDKAPFTMVEFRVTPEYEIRRLIVAGDGGATTDFRFDQEKLNPPVADKLFQFQPPAGAEVVEEAER